MISLTTSAWANTRGKPNHEHSISINRSDEILVTRTKSSDNKHASDEMSCINDSAVVVRHDILFTSTSTANSIW